MTGLPTYEELAKHLGHNPTEQEVLNLFPVNKLSLRRWEYIPNGPRIKPIKAKITVQYVRRTFARLNAIARSEFLDWQIAEALTLDSEQIEFLEHYLWDVARRKRQDENGTQENAPQKCAQCGKRLRHRTDALYCSSACRQKAYRKRALRPGLDIERKNRNASQILPPIAPISRNAQDDFPDIPDFLRRVPMEAAP
jgi:hypothetical protein